jgi:hypothetical protein
LSRQDAADEFGVSLQTIDRRIRVGDLPAFRIGGQSTWRWSSPHRVRSIAGQGEVTAR